MSDPIKVGDLVMVVRYHDCEPSHGCGVVFMVEALDTARDHWCSRCNASLNDGRLLVLGTRNAKKGWLSASFVKKIDPPALEETTDEPAELAA